MRTLRFICIIIISIGFSINGFCQDENQKLSTFNYKHQIENSIGISIKTADNWNVIKRKKGEFIIIENKLTKSSLTIHLKDKYVILNDLFDRIDSENEELKEKNKYLDVISKKELIEYIKELDSIDKEKPHITFSRIKSKQKGDYKLTTIYMIINRNGYLIEAKNPYNCDECYNEIKFMIETLENLE